MQGDDVELVARLRGLLQLDVIMVLLTGLQAICAGIIGASTRRLLLPLHPVVAVDLPFSADNYSASRTATLHLAKS